MYLGQVLHPHTLAFHKARPLFVRSANFGKASLPNVVKAMNAYFDKAPGMVYPEATALRFYCLNHLWSEMLREFDPHEVRPQASALANEYLTSSMAIGQRLFYYVLLATTRESRHLHSSANLGLSDEYRAFRDSLPGGSTQAADKLKKSPVDMPLVDYVQSLSTVFHKGSFNSSFGGPKWGNISDALLKLVQGEISMEGFIDTAWTLEHNGGCMFNKGMLFETHCGSLAHILDVQRSGQIPHLVTELSKGTCDLSIHQVYGEDLTSLYTDVLTLQKMVPAISYEFVDWYVVEKFGLHKYKAQQQKQLAKHGVSPLAAAEQQEEAAKFYVTDDEYSVIYKRKAA